MIWHPVSEKDMIWEMQLVMKGIIMVEIQFNELIQSIFMM